MLTPLQSIRDRVHTTLTGLEQGTTSSEGAEGQLRLIYNELSDQIKQIKSGFHLIIGVTSGLVETVEGPFLTEEEAQVKRIAMAEDYGTPGDDDIYRVHVQFLPLFTQYYHDGPVEPIDEPDDDPYDEVLIHTMATEGGPG